MRDLIIAGNWKMNKDLNQCRDFCASLAEYAIQHSETQVKIVIAPPYPFLLLAEQLLADCPVSISAQDVSANSDGAFTGEVSASMLASLKLPYCIVGHSERRQYHQETNSSVRSRIQKLQQEGIVPIVCVGETLTERESGNTDVVVLSQLRECLEDIQVLDSSDIVIAYEPVWAIGTGRVASPEQAQEVHALIRQYLSTKYAGLASEIVVLYGGSMKPENIASLLQMPDIDGGLIGGASLNLEHFCQMIDSAKEEIKRRRSI